jgi:ankyrin repeat protein
LGVFLQPEAFEDFFINEKARFFDQDKKDRAKADLLARGISCYEENFLNIVSSGDSEAVRLFLDAGFSASAVDPKGIPLLSHAVRSQFPEIVEMLLDAGADVNGVSGDRGYSPLMDAVQKGDVAMVELLLRRGANTELKSKDGQTALIICAGRGDVPMAKILIANGSNPTASDHLGMNAIKYANLFKNEKMIELFNTSPA